jgi:hypothetical protein
MRVQFHERIRIQSRSGGPHMLVPDMVRYRYPNNRTEQNYCHCYMDTGHVTGVPTFCCGILFRLMFFKANGKKYNVKIKWVGYGRFL